MLYIMRHGKTDWNAARRIQGHTDIPLNEEGRQMAIDAREKYRGIKFDVCYCSTLIRAKETAQLFLEGSGTPIIEDTRLMEMSFGIYEGYSNVDAIPGCPIIPMFNDPPNYKGVEGGETFQQLADRTGEFLREVAIPLSEEGKNVLLVAHGATNCSIAGHIRGIPLDKFWDVVMDNCELVRML